MNNKLFIFAPAIKLLNKYYTGPSYLDITMRLTSTGNYDTKSAIELGFVTNELKFVNAREAKIIAESAEQLKVYNDELELSPDNLLNMDAEFHTIDPELSLDTTNILNDDPIALGVALGFYISRDGFNGEWKSDDLSPTSLFENLVDNKELLDVISEYEKSERFIMLRNECINFIKSYLDNNSTKG